MPPRIGLTLLLLLLAPAALRAGIYNTAEPDEGRPSTDFRKFHATLLELQTLGRDIETVGSPVRKRFVLLTDAARLPLPAGWSVEQKMDLGAYLLRRRNFNLAKQVLEAGLAQERSFFSGLADLR